MLLTKMVAGVESVEIDRASNSEDIVRRVERKSLADILEVSYNVMLDDSCSVVFTSTVIKDDRHPIVFFR